MATVQDRNGSFRVLFCYQGKRHTVNLGKVSRDEADAFSGSVDLLLMRLKQRLISVPAGVEIVDFMRGGGKALEAPTTVAAEKVSLARLREAYLKTHGDGAMEANSLATAAMHLGHFARTLGEKFPIQELQLADLQRHVSERRKKKYRGRLLSPVTLRKEIASFRAAWNWGVLTGMFKGTFPGKGIVYPKTDEKLPFMTWAEINRRITPDMTPDRASELWDCLYLTKTDADELLTHVKGHAAHAWVYPVFAFAFHTGARRSEIIRVLAADVDFDAGVVTIREKKRNRKQRTTRRIPLTPFLADVLREWLTKRPGGEYLFCHAGEVTRSKKRSGTTGHKGEATRESSLKGRLKSVRKREAPALGTLTKDEMHDHFRRTLAGSKWAVVPGWHCFRHSFISLCASRGCDQRLIDEWTGHSTEEQRRRYRHLFPSTQKAAIASVFE